MRERKNFRFAFVFWAILFIFTLFSSAGVIEKDPGIPIAKIEERVKNLMADWDIPGLSLAIVKGDTVYTQGFGYADAEKEIPVTPGTHFELASTSKAFTALAILKLEKEGLVNLDAPVITYLPWLHVLYRGRDYPVTVRQFLHHTSGIPTKSIALIPRSDAKDALQQTVRKLVNYELVRKPGTEFEYATINYDVLGAVIESVSGLSFEEYLEKNILVPMGMTKTFVGRPENSNEIASMARGYKIGFFTAREYDAPVYRGNNPAGYVISNANDMLGWLKIQIGLVENPFRTLVEESHKPDQTVGINQATLGAYGMGWFSYMNGTDTRDHQGLNPNYTAYIGFSPKEKLGVAVLANSNSTATPWIGYYIMGVLRGQELASLNIPGDAIDKGSAVIGFMVGFFILCILAFYISIPLDVAKGARRFEGLNLKKIGNWLLVLFAFIPFLYGLYLLPGAMSGVNWDTAAVFGPSSFRVVITLIILSMGMCWLGFVISSLFPQQNKYKRRAPLLLVLSVASGGANAIIIFLINASVFSTTGLFYQLYFFIMAFLLYIIGRKILQTELIKITFDIIYDLRMNLVRKIFNTSYQSFEKVDRGRVLATLNDDTTQISNAANIVVMFATSIITIFGSFIYLAAMAFWATALTLLVVFFVAGLYYIVTEKTNVLFEEARDTQNQFMGFLNGMLDGFKELSMHYNKRMQYQADVAGSVDAMRKKLGLALIKFVNAFLVGESLLIITLAAVGFGISRVFTDISRLTIMGFIMILLYLIGPFNALLRSVPEIIRMRISWARIEQFSKDVPANIDPSLVKAPEKLPAAIESIKAEGVMFEYKSENELEQFRIGPLDFEAHKGEIIFIVGGNGSGKTTLAKILTGLYIPGGGVVRINGKEKANYEIGEYFSVVFSDYHLFEKLYNADLTGKEEEIQKYLKLLRLEQKVVLENNAFSTVDLSGGQRKRLALLQCYLEGHPIYLFDEVAADQDPEFRKFFYRDLLQRMKEEGKIIIAITHDDHYFDVADRVIKMDMGQIETVSSDYRTTAALA